METGSEGDELDGKSSQTVDLFMAFLFSLKVLNAVFFRHINRAIGL